MHRVAPKLLVESRGVDDLERDTRLGDLAGETGCGGLGREQGEKLAALHPQGFAHRMDAIENREFGGGPAERGIRRRMRMPLGGLRLVARPGWGRAGIPVELLPVLFHVGLLRPAHVSRPRPCGNLRGKLRLTGRAALRIETPLGSPLAARHGGMSRAAKGADCKSAGYAFAGSSPASPTTLLFER